MPKRRNLKSKLNTVKKIAKKSRRTNATKVRKMLAAVMEQHQARQMNGANSKAVDSVTASGGQPNEKDNEEFYSTGRTGRRNALPDILGENAHVTSSDLPARLQALTTSSDQPSTSADSQPGPSNRTPTH